MKAFKVFLACVAFTNGAVADPLVRQYIEEIVRQNVKIPDAELEFSEWQQSVSGGYILRFAFDVDDDGAAEQFFASSFNADKLVCEWTVYAGASEVPLSKSTSLRPDGFWWNPVKREMLDYVRLGAEGGSAIFSQFVKDSLTTRNEPASIDEVITGLGRDTAPRQGFQRIKPDVMVSLLADLVENTGSGWRRLILDDAGNNYTLPNGRLLLTEDSSRVETLKNFTPNEASAVLQKSEPHSEQPSDKPPMTKKSPMVTPSPKLKAPETKPLAAKEEISSSTPWGMIAVLIVAALWLLWLRLKRRS